MRKFINAVLAGMMLAFATIVSAGVDTETDANDVILAGHDAVAYFSEGKPVLGSPKYTAAFGGAIYRFASAKNRNKFQANPQQYAPVYGGWCALGTSFGKKFEVDGKAFEIVDGRLYVNKNRKAYNVWKKDVAGNIVKADGYWPQIRDVPAEDL